MENHDKNKGSFGCATTEKGLELHHAVFDASTKFFRAAIQEGWSSPHAVGRAMEEATRAVVAAFIGVCW